MAKKIGVMIFPPIYDIIVALRIKTGTDETMDIFPDSSKSAHILIVDDMAVNRTILSSMITTMGISCDLAQSGQECLDMCLKENYDLILLDHRMPGMNGDQVLQRIRSNPSNERIPVIFLTEMNDKEGVMKILGQRPDGYLLKSMPREMLLDSLQRFFAESSASFSSSSSN